MDSNALARLKTVARRQTLTLTHYGRTSGKPYNVTIWFVVNGDKVYLGTANVNRQWVRNVQKTQRVELSIGSEKFDGIARFVSNPAEHERTMAMMRRKYWMFWPVITMGRILMAAGMMRDNTGSFEVTLAS
jgi:deazaflavin-dependent oxidoreductase (nitroreductase family)